MTVRTHRAERPKAAVGDARGRLWAPWRMTYIRAAEVAKRRPTPRRSARAACLFCQLRRGGENRENLVLARRQNAYLMLNRFPYNPGHLMVAVARHAGVFRALSLEERSDLLELTALAERALAAEYRPDGINYGANVGRVAGAGYPGHLHLHLVPRWSGDTNFMPAIGETKVLPESLMRTWSRLRRAIREVGAAPEARASSEGSAPGRAPRTRRSLAQAR